MSEETNFNITEENTEAVLCGKCKSPIFEQCIVMRKVSAFISPTGKEELIQMPLMVCKGCGTPMIEDMGDQETEEKSPIIQ